MYLMISKYRNGNAHRFAVVVSQEGEVEDKIRKYCRSRGPRWEQWFQGADFVSQQRITSDCIVVS